MKAARYQPKRRLANEIYSLAAVLSVPAAVALMLPHDAFTFRARAVPEPPPAACSFVELAAAESATALASARAALKTGEGGVAGRYASLSIDDLPATPPEEVALPPSRSVNCERMFVPYFGQPAPPSAGAAKAARLELEKIIVPDAFPRQSMLDDAMIPGNTP